LHTINKGYDFSKLILRDFIISFISYNKNQLTTMKNAKNPLSFYTNQLAREEMKSYFAGDDLPEVIVYSSYTKYWHMNYYSWSMIFPFGIGGGALPKSIGDEIIYGGGGGFAPSTNPEDNSSFVKDFNKFLSALSLMSDTQGLTFDTIHAFFSDTANIGLLKNLAKHATILGVGLSFLEVIDHAYTGGLGSLTVGDAITFSLGVLSIIALLPSIGATFGITVGVAGLGYDMYKAIN
jgi:hypothetical protein